MSDEVNTFTMKLADRDIQFRRPNLGQVLMLQRLAMRSVAKAKQASDDTERGDFMASAMVRTLDFIEGLIISEQDRDFVEEQMILGNIDYPELMAALSGGTPDSTEDDQAPKPLKKTPKKAAKTVASRARTKR